jgi:hypothetical protein
MQRIRHIISLQISDLWHLLSAIYQEEDWCCMIFLYTGNQVYGYLMINGLKLIHFPVP